MAPLELMIVHLIAPGFELWHDAAAAPVHVQHPVVIPVTHINEGLPCTEGRRYNIRVLASAHSRQWEQGPRS